MLEPSPPAIDSAPWYADDPVARGDVPAGRQVVSPVGTGDLRWDQLIRDDTELAGWCAERWLGAYRRLPEVPPELVATRLALHALAERVISPARRSPFKRSFAFGGSGRSTPQRPGWPISKISGSSICKARLPVTVARATAVSGETPPARP